MLQPEGSHNMENPHVTVTVWSAGNTSDIHPSGTYIVAIPEKVTPPVFLFSLFSPSCRGDCKIRAG